MKSNFLTENSGKPSMMRLMAVLSLFTSVWFGWITLTDKEIESNEGVYITSAFLIGAFAPKALQKFIENNTIIDIDGSEDPK